MAEQQEREWVRNHRVAGFVAGRFSGEYAGEQRELVALQTWDGVTVVPAAALIAVDKDYMVRQAALDLERVIRGMAEGGLSLDDAQAAWECALGHAREVAARDERTHQPAPDRS
jgi:hypothetical protein